MMWVSEAPAGQPRRRRVGRRVGPRPIVAAARSSVTKIAIATASSIGALISARAPVPDVGSPASAATE